MDETTRRESDQARPRFRLKLGGDQADKKKEAVKLFSKKEAEEESDRLTTIYIHLSGLVDDLLEIIVKGHQPVSIWHLSEDEARGLAEMHLQEAQTSNEAARSARSLLALYNRYFLFALFGPRLLASGRLIKQQGGLSFK